MSFTNQFLILSKYACAISFKDKKLLLLLIAFWGILDNWKKNKTKKKQQQRNKQNIGWSNR